MAFTRFCRAVARQAGRSSSTATGEQVRDFTYVDDVVEANLPGRRRPGLAPGAVLNVAGGSSTTVNEVLELLGEISGREVPGRSRRPGPG